MPKADMSLVLKGITGPETGGAMQIESWTWGESGGGGVGKVHMDDFHFIMAVNDASPKVLEHCATGETIPTATLTCKEADQTYLVIKLNTCKVSYFHTSVSGGEGSIAKDQFSLSFKQIEYVYTKKGSTLKRDGGNIGTKFDLDKNKTY